MKNFITKSLLLLMTVALTVACSSESETTENETSGVPSDGEVLTPIRITANYAGDDVRSNATRVSYSEDGSDISATWQAGDQLYVYYNGHVNTLTLTDGTGTNTATFEGSIQGTPSFNSVLICYVKDTNNPSAVSVNNNGEYTYAAGTFLGQDGTLAGAAKCNLYYGTTTYGTGENISCDFSVNTSMMKFTVSAPDDVSEGDEATLTYKSDGTAISKATFTVGENGMNTIYLTVPAGQHTGAQTVQFVSGTANETETLSATKANFKAGETYSKGLYYGDSDILIANLGTNSEYIGYVLAANGKAYPSVSKANKYSTATGMIAYLGNCNGADGQSAYSEDYNHGLAMALDDVPGGTYQLSGILSAASAYSVARPSASSGWFLLSAFQWMRIMEACGGSTFSTSIWREMSFSYGNLQTKLSSCGANGLRTSDWNGYYTSTAESGGDYWAYRTDGCYFTDTEYSYFYGRTAYAF